MNKPKKAKKIIVKECLKVNKELDERKKNEKEEENKDKETGV